MVKHSFSGVLALLMGGILLGAMVGCTFSADPSPVPETPPSLTVESVHMGSQVKQGEVLKITVDAPTPDLQLNAAWLAGVKAPLFYQTATHTWEALMPTKVDQKVGGYPIKIQNVAGQTLYTGQVEITNAGYSRQNISVSGSMAGHKTAEPGELEAMAALKTDTSPEKYWSEPLVKPTEDCMNSRFGNLRYHNGKFTDNYHRGVDLRSPQGRPVKAIAGGKVKIARNYRLHGGTVGLDHGQGMSSVYIHLSQILVKPGDTVEQGQVVGKVGSTGFATGPHLHWGLFVNGYPVNPVQWLAHRSCG